MIVISFVSTMTVPLILLIDQPPSIDKLAYSIGMIAITLAALFSSIGISIWIIGETPEKIKADIEYDLRKVKSTNKCDCFICSLFN